MKPSPIFDDLLTEYAKNFGVFEDINKHLNETIETILANITGVIEKKVDDFNKKHKDVGLLFEPTADDWESHITLRRKNTKKHIIRLAYGFSNEIIFHDKLVNRDSIYFYILIKPLKDGNGFKKWPELRSFWKQKMVPWQRNGKYIIPLIPNDNDAYSYYGIYTLHESQIRNVFKQRGLKKYSDEVAMAFDVEFKTNLKYYVGLKEEIKKWRAISEEE